MCENYHIQWKFLLLSPISDQVCMVLECENSVSRMSLKIIAHMKMNVLIQNQHVSLFLEIILFIGGTGNTHEYVRHTKPTVCLMA